MTAPTDRSGLPLVVYVYFHPGDLPPDNRRVSLGFSRDEKQLFVKGEWRDHKLPWYLKADVKTIQSDYAKAILEAVLGITGVDDVQPESIRGFCVQFALEFKAPEGHDQLIELLKEALNGATQREIQTLII
jgi:hypothetical protein